MRDDGGALTATAEGVRPTLPESCPRNLARLIESCWAYSPDRRCAGAVAARPADVRVAPTNRPSFIEILPIMELVMLNAAIEDPIGRRLWRYAFFQTQTYDHCTISKLISSVPWPDFMRMLESVLAFRRLSVGASTSARARARRSSTSRPVRSSSRPI